MTLKLDDFHGIFWGVLSAHLKEFVKKKKWFVWQWFKKKNNNTTGVVKVSPPPFIKIDQISLYFGPLHYWYWIKRYCVILVTSKESPPDYQYYCTIFYIIFFNMIYGWNCAILLLNLKLFFLIDSNDVEGP